MQPSRDQPARKLHPSYANRRVLVTGVAGFIGFHVARRLLAAGARVAGIDNVNAYYDQDLKWARLGQLRGVRGFAFEKIDLVDGAGLLANWRAFDPEVVIHLAAQAGVRYSIDNPQAYADSNLTGFLNVLEAGRRHPVTHLIYASSSSVYGLNGKTPFSEHDRADHPISLYAATKRANELMAHTYAHLFGVPLTGLRFFTIYGPWGRPDMAYFKFTRAIEAGQPIDVYNGGDMERDFTYIDDAVDAIVALVDLPPRANPNFDPLNPDPATANAPHRVYNVGNNSPVSLRRFIAAIESAVGRKAIERPLPMQPGDVPRTFADIDDLAAAVGFAPNTSIEAGIAQFVDWSREFYLESSPSQRRQT